MRSRSNASVLCLLWIVSVAPPLVAADVDYDSEEVLDRALESAIDDLEGRLAAAEAALDLLAAAPDDARMGDVGLRAVADTLRGVHLSLALMGCHQGLDEVLAEERHEKLSRRLAQVGHRASTLVGAGTSVPDECHPLFGCPPPPPNPICVYICELINRYCIRTAKCLPRVCEAHC